MRQTVRVPDLTTNILWHTAESGKITSAAEAVSLSQHYKPVDRTRLPRKRTQRTVEHQTSTYARSSQFGANILSFHSPYFLGKTWLLLTVSRDSPAWRHACSPTFWKCFLCPPPRFLPSASQKNESRTHQDKRQQEFTIFPGLHFWGWFHSIKSGPQLKIWDRSSWKGNWGKGGVGEYHGRGNVVSVLRHRKGRKEGGDGGKSGSSVLLLQFS